jgi:metal-sulfur cluster biosynthetic enzyme
VNIYDLGLVYGIEVGGDRSVAIKMTLTSPSCPVAESLPPEVEQKVKAIPGIGPVTVDLVWEPPWGKHLLSEAARLQLGLF